MTAQITEETLGELEEIAQRTVELARRAGADVAEVLVRDGSELTAMVRLGKSELIQEAASRALGLRVLRGARRARTHTSDLRPAAIKALCEQTCELADHAQPDQCALPPTADLYATNVEDLELYDPALAAIDAEWALGQAYEGESAARAHDLRITNSDGASWSRVLSATAFATSGGFVGSYRGSHASLIVEPLCDEHVDGLSRQRSGSWWTSSRFLSSLSDPRAVGVEAARRTIAMLSSRRVATQECPVIFDPEAAKSIVGMVAIVASGAAFWRRSTYLLGREGQRVASPLVTIIDDPLIKRGFGSRPFDGDGIRVRKNIIIDRGMLSTVLCDLYSARKLGRTSTGSAGRSIDGIPSPTTSNLIMVGGNISRHELVRRTPRGFYVTGLMGYGFNPVTGDFSRGAQGFWIEDGELAFPVSEITIAANFDQILQRIDLVADDLELRAPTAAPTFRVSHMTVAGV